jgi:hypothetical protein
VASDGPAPGSWTGRNAYSGGHSATGSTSRLDSQQRTPAPCAPVTLRAGGVAHTTQLGTGGSYPRKRREKGAGRDADALQTLRLAQVSQAPADRRPMLQSRLDALRRLLKGE